MKIEEVEKFVKNTDGLWDEKGQPHLYHINERKSCWLRRHQWVNASLHCQKKIDEDSFWSTNWEPFKNDEASWPYAHFRFCKRCKVIDCVHLFLTRYTYKIKYPYKIKFNDKLEQAYDAYYVGKCDRCKKKILIGSWGHYTYFPNGISEDQLVRI